MIPKGIKNNSLVLNLCDKKYTNVTDAMTAFNPIIIE